MPSPSGMLEVCEPFKHEAQASFIEMGPKTGFNRVQNTAKQFGDFLFFLVFEYNYCFFTGFNYSRIANFDFRTYCKSSDSQI